MLGASAREAIRAEMTSAPRGARTGTAERLAALYGCSRGTVYRIARLGGAKRPREAARPEYREAVRVATDLARRAPLPAPLDIALDAAVESGLIDAAQRPPTGTAHRIAREEGLRPPPRRTQRMSADYPMQAVQIDGSTSQFLAVGGDGGGGDYELRLVERISARGYKNKPLAEHRLRLQYYGVWDMCTGYWRAAVVAARGESALDQTEAFVAMLTETGDPARPMHGIPCDVWSDNGAWCKSPAARGLMEGLESNIVRGEPYAKERMGGVERGWRTVWRRFEASLYLRGTRTILLSELRERLFEFERRENAARRSRTPVAGRRASRAAAWTALVNARPADNPLRGMPPNAIETLALEVERVVDRNGIVRWGGIEYECPDFHCRRVIARRHPSGEDGGIVVERMDTGERRAARPLEARPYGAVRAAAATALDKLDAEAPSAGAAADVWAPRPAAPGVTPMRPRAAEAERLPDPFDADGLGSLDEALALFGDLAGGLPAGAARDMLADEIRSRGLSRREVAGIAAEFRAAGG
ncbi:MAG: hypothetical protein OXG90_12880 [Gammaproteobacteria bacterium]|nr:hypothetical protein [Gammaproteobacteria bacterium]